MNQLASKEKERKWTKTNDTKWIKYLKTIQTLGRSASIRFILLLCNLDRFNDRSRCQLHRGPPWRMLRSEHVHCVLGIPGFGSPRRVHIGPGTLGIPDTDGVFYDISMISTFASLGKIFPLGFCQVERC